MSTSDYLFAASHVGTENAIQEETYFAALVARCTLNLKNERVFADEDVKLLSEAEAGFILPLALKIQQLSGNLESEEDVKKGITSLRENHFEMFCLELMMYWGLTYEQFNEQPLALINRLFLLNSVRPFLPSNSWVQSGTIAAATYNVNPW